MKLYHGFGHSYLVCPRLLELDLRHGEHPSKWPVCRRGGRKEDKCTLQHKHEAVLVDHEGHSAADLYWFPGCVPPAPEEHRCRCGRSLVAADLDDPFAGHMVIESAGDANLEPGMLTAPE